jgi:hypothetical protein
VGTVTVGFEDVVGTIDLAPPRGRAPRQRPRRLLRRDTATDREVWDHAAEHGYVIASKDSDFRQLAFLTT